VSREEASKLPPSRGVANSRSRVPSCSSGHVSPPLQMLFLQQPLWYPVFWCLLPRKKGSKILPGSATLAGVILRHSSRTDWGLLRCHCLSRFSWLALVTYPSFSERQKVKSHFTDGHGTERLCRHLGARGYGHLRCEDFPSWTSPTGLQVLQQTAGLSGLHEGAFEHSQFRGRDGLTHLKGEKRKGFKYILIIRHASNVFPDVSSGDQMKKANIC